MSGNREGSIDLSDETKRDAFLAVQFSSLRQEIELQISERRKVESETFLAMAAIYAWTFGRQAPLSPIYLKVSLMIPVILSLLGLLRWSGIMIRTMTIGRYLLEIEGRIVGPDSGWEAYLTAHRTSRPFVGRMEGFSIIGAWILAAVGSLVLLVKVYPT